MWDFSFFSPMTRSAEVDRWSRAGTSAAVRNMGSSFLLFHPQYVGFVLFVHLMITIWLLHLQTLPLKFQARRRKKKKQEGSRPVQSVSQRSSWRPYPEDFCLLLTGQNGWPLLFDGDQVKRDSGWASNTKYSTSFIHLVLFNIHQESTMFQAFY